MFPARLRLSGLWRNPDFLKLWSGQTISILGSQITLLALPLTAVLVLHAGPAQMGVLGGVQLAPEFVLSLAAGVWVDRLPRRPILLAADIGRAMLLGSVPIAAALGALHFEYLYVIGFLVGVCTVFFGVAYSAYLPAVAGPALLVDGNSKLQASYSVAIATGQAVGGSVIQLLTAPFAVALDAVSFIVSAVCLASMSTNDNPAPTELLRRNMVREAGEGLRLMSREPMLRAIAGSGCLSNFFGQLAGALYILYMTRELAISPAALGIILAVFGIGSFLGAVLTAPIVRVFGIGLAMIGPLAIAAIAALFIPLAGALPHRTIIPVLAVVQFLIGCASPIGNITAASIRQSITPRRLLGRANATTRFIFQGVRPLGQVIGGVCGVLLGVQMTLALAACGILLSVLWLVLSPIRGLQALPVAIGDCQPTMVVDVVASDSATL